MRNIVKAILNFPRMLFPMLAYITAENKSIIKSDIGYRNNIYIYIYIKLINDKAYRRLFYYRISTQNIISRIFMMFSKVVLPPMDTFSIDVDSIGTHMKIFHGYSTIVHAKSIGNNFSVYQQVTIGRGKSVNGNCIPIIGDNVTIYAGAIVIGGITVGDNAVIGAGTVVTQDVPTGATVVGSKMRIINRG